MAPASAVEGIEPAPIGNERPEPVGPVNRGIGLVGETVKRLLLKTLCGDLTDDGAEILVRLVTCLV